MFFLGEEGISSEGIIHGALICVKGWPLSRVGDYSGGNCPRGRLSSGGIIRGYPGGNYPGGNYPGGNYPGGNYPGGNCPGGNYPGGGGGGAIVRIPHSE